MKYNNQMTIHQVETYLDRVTTVSELIKFTDSVHREIDATFERITRICKRITSRSSISAAYMYQVARSREQRAAIHQQLNEVNAIIQMVNEELSEEVDGLAAYHRQHQRIMQKLHDELAMEELLSQVHELVYQ